MDTQDPTDRPRYQFPGVLLSLDNEKDAMMSRCLDRKQIPMRHLASAHQGQPASMHAYRMTFSVVWRAGLRRLD